MEIVLGAVYIKNLFGIAPDTGGRLAFDRTIGSTGSGNGANFHRTAGVQVHIPLGERNEFLVRHNQFTSIPVGNGGGAYTNTRNRAARITNGDRITHPERPFKQYDQAADKIMVSTL